MFAAILKRGLLALVFAAPLSAAPLKILAIGDSLTEEYGNPTFSALVYGPNVKNWVELTAQYRSAEVSFGVQGTSNDFRTNGYRLNFGFPGLTAADWLNVINNVPGGYLIFQYNQSTRTALISELPNAEVVVILIGANDLSDIYGSVFNNTAGPNAMNDIVNRIDAIHTFVRAQRPTVPIVLSTIADIGATPDKAGEYSDPAKRITTRAKVAALNQSIITLAATRGATVARIDRLTDRAYDEVPFQLNGTNFILAGASNNPPGRVFCEDDFHPATVGQALIANEVLAACATATGRTLTTFSNREILTLLNFNPDAPYNAWVASNPGLGAGTADDDRDGLPNLVEYTLGTAPKTATQPFQFPAPANGTLKFQTSATALKYASLAVMESADLVSWSPVPANRITFGGDGSWTVTPNGSGKAFYRLKAQTRP